jgi:hypothetical protein
VTVRANFLRLHVSYFIFAGRCRIGKVAEIRNLAVSGVPKYYTRNVSTWATAKQLALVIDMQVTSVRDNAILYRRIHDFNYC